MGDLSTMAGTPLRQTRQLDSLHEFVHGLSCLTGETCGSWWCCGAGGALRIDKSICTDELSLNASLFLPFNISSTIVSVSIILLLLLNWGCTYRSSQSCCSPSSRVFCLFHNAINRLSFDPAYHVRTCVLISRR